MSGKASARNTAILVVGMHRSGTSALTRVINLLGANLGGSLLGPGKGNAKGHWENTEAIAINDAVLGGLGLSWDDTQPLPQDWVHSAVARQAIRRISTLIAHEFADSPLWALKDPRLCRLLPIWLDALERSNVDVRIVFSIRHPGEVAESLNFRDGLDMASSQLRWLQHIAEAELATRDCRRTVVLYGDLLADWRGVVGRMGAGLGIRWPVMPAVVATDVDAFLSPVERHYSATDHTAPDLLRAPAMLYSAFAACARGEDGWGPVSSLVDTYQLWSPSFLCDIRRRGEEAKVLADRLGNAEADAHAANAQIASQAETIRDDERKLFGLLETVQGKDVQIQNRDQIIRDKDAQLLDTGRRLIDSLDAAQARDEQIRDRDRVIFDRNAEVERRGALLADKDAQLRASDARAAELAGALVEAKRYLSTATSDLVDRDRSIAAIQSTLSWRVTRPLRGLRRLGSALAHYRVVEAVVRPIAKARHVGQTLRATLGDPERRMRYFTLARVLGPRAATHHAVAYLRRGGPRPRPPVPVPAFDLRPGLGKRAIILTTPHCDFVAYSIQHALHKIGVQSSIIHAQPDTGYENLPHFVICPQMFERLPELYVAFQMEQSVSTRWFTDAYLRMLENSFAILDYSVANIEALVCKGLQRKQFFYLPLGYLPDYGTASSGSEEAYDAVFYGDINNDRRRHFVTALEKVCRVKVIHDLFGEPLHAELAKARLIVNVHYYEGALLETTRLWECVSLGKLVVSERAVNMGENGDLEKLIDFVDLNDVDGMVERVRHWLANESERRARLKANRNLAQRQANRFEYFFYRFLLAWDIISFHRFWQLAGSKLTLEGDKLCLNLPEWFGRRRSFDQDNHFGFQVFPGLRHREGWIGCGLSYKLMIMLARKQRVPQITICEDDVEFHVGFTEDFAEIQTELAAGHERWDVFSGLLGDLHVDAQILQVRNLHNRKFVLTNRLISMVFNIYHRDVFDRVALWDDKDRDVVKNTIDRYLEHTRLSVLACYPFLVGHKEELHSTLWGVQNNTMAGMIQRSERLLGSKIEEFEADVQQA